MHPRILWPAAIARIRMISTKSFYSLCLGVSFLCMSCRKDDTGINDPSRWVTRQQISVSWPGVANSAWPMRLHDPQHTGRSPYAGPQVGTIEWRLDAGSEVYCSPAIGQDGTVLIGALSGQLLAVSPAGIVLWQIPQGGGDGSLVLSSDGSIYGCSGGLFKSHDRSGNLIWAYQFGSNGISPFTPTISKEGGTVYLAADSLYSFTKGGVLRWAMKPDSTDQLGTCPALSPDGSMIYTTGLKALYAVDTSGTLKWRFLNQGSDPAVDCDGNIYIASSQGGLFSLNPSGKVRWTATNVNWGYLYQLNPVIGWDGTIYMAGHAGVYVFDFGGNLKWKYSLPAGADLESVPAIDQDGVLYLGWATGRTLADSINFMALNPDGKLKFQVSLKNPDSSVPDIDSDPAISSDQTIYIGSDRPKGRYLFKIR